jgi:hypothetical protein
MLPAGCKTARKFSRAVRMDQIGDGSFEKPQSRISLRRVNNPSNPV